MRNPAIHVLSVVFILIAAAQASAQEWSRYLGSEGHAYSAATTVPAKFTVADYNWQVKLPGKGHSSPVVWGNKLILTAVSSASERHVHCFDTKTGAENWKWSQKFVPHNRHQFNERAASTPCIDAERIYVTWSSSAGPDVKDQAGSDPVPGEAEVFALDHDGNEVWRKELGNFSGDHGSASSPILVDGKLFIFWDDLLGEATYFSALNPANGEEIWHRKREWDGRKLKTTYSSPAIHKNSKGQTELIISSMPFGVISIDAANGDELWSYDHGFKARTVATPVIEDGVVFATWGSGNGAKDHVALIPGTSTPEGKTKIAWRWTKQNGAPDNKGLPYVPTVLGKDGLLYCWADSGLLQVVNAKTGKVVYGPERVGGSFFSNPVMIGDKIYCANRDLGEMVVVKAGETFEVIARNKLDSGVNATPAVSGGTLYIRTNEHLISVGGK